MSITALAESAAAPVLVESKREALDKYMELISGQPHTHDGVTGHIHTKYVPYVVPGRPSTPTGVGSWTMWHAADVKGKEHPNYVAKKEKLKDDFVTHFDDVDSKPPFFAKEWDQANKEHGTNESKALILKALTVEEGIHGLMWANLVSQAANVAKAEKSHAVVHWHDGRPVGLTANMSRAAATAYADAATDDHEVVERDRAAVIRKHMASGHAEKYVNKMPPAEEAAPVVPALVIEGHVRNLRVVAGLSARKAVKEGGIKFADLSTKRPIIGRLVEKRTLADKSVLTIVEHPDTKVRISLRASDILA
jgi:hypothetical protein